MEKVELQPESPRRKRTQRGVLPALLGALLLLGACAVGVPTYFNTIKPAGIVIHHSAMPVSINGAELDVRLLDEIHRKRGYAIFYGGRVYHVGYHYVILPDGTVQQGRPERCKGSHARGYNDYIGICLVGDFSDPAGRREDHGPSEPTEAQMRSLVELCMRLQQRYGIPIERVVRHNDLNAETECPGERFPFHDLIRRLGQRVPSQE
jgi:N-acetylmuramoyl-L-alanine amidase